MPCSDPFALLSAQPPMPVRIMEICGTHTMSIARAGLRRLLPEGVQLLSGPGCPVCVTPAASIDAALALTELPGVTVATYGDMMRVPGSRRGDSLARRRALGAQVEVVYSATDALELARSRPERTVVFLAVGFETTAPGTAAAVLEAEEQQLSNFLVFSMLKRVEPALRTLLALDSFDVQGFLCPGHVATILGEDGFSYLPQEYGLPGVIAGFSPQEIAHAITELLTLLRQGTPKICNAYPRGVARNGNPLAREMIARVFTPVDSRWRGLGVIAESGLAPRAEFAAFDAQQRLPLPEAEEAPSACRCGDVMAGQIAPNECPLFAGVCTPDDPAGPCMVSSEGACAAYYKYGI